MISNERHVEAIVIGSGPAGMALAASLLNAGVETLCISPRFEKWAPNYGVWPDQLVGLGFEDHYEKVWPNVRVSTPTSGPRVFARPYAKIDGSSLFSTWHDLLCGEDATLVDSVLSVFFDPSGGHLTLQSGVTVHARHVFDATGHGSKWVRRNPTSVAFQTAFGVEIPSVNRTMSGSTMGLMDWHDGIVINAENRRIPAFDYVMPLFGEITFLELTVLSARPMVPVDDLRERLAKNLNSIDIENLKYERCVIPMGHSVPRLEQQIVGFGGAASMVHPATGYMVERCFRVAPEIGEAAVALRSESPKSASRALWDVVWPSSRARSHELLRFGLEALLRLTPEQTYAFFDAFFDLPQERWVGYLSGMAPPGEIASTMLQVFSRAGFSLRRELVGTAFGPEVRKLVRAMF